MQENLWWNTLINFLHNYLPPTRLISPPSLFGKLEYIILVQVLGVISVIKCWLSVWYLIAISVTKWENCGTSEIFNKHWNIKKYAWRWALHLMTDLETWYVHAKLFCFITIESPTNTLTTSRTTQMELTIKNRTCYVYIYLYVRSLWTVLKGRLNSVSVYKKGCKMFNSGALTTRPNFFHHNGYWS